MSNVREEFLYLNRLRESGDTNMWGASPYIQEQFFVNRKEASKILTDWMAWVQENPSNRDL
jgi:predicted KAP-like P-loop ATPase